MSQSAFDPESVGNDGGLGFVSMRERLNLVGGELLIESQPSAGTRIKASVPLNSSNSLIEHPTEVQEATTVREAFVDTKGTSDLRIND